VLFYIRNSTQFANKWIFYITLAKAISPIPSLDHVNELRERIPRCFLGGESIPVYFLDVSLRYLLNSRASQQSVEIKMKYWGMSCMFIIDFLYFMG